MYKFNKNYMKLFGIIIDVMFSLITITIMGIYLFLVIFRKKYIISLNTDEILQHTVILKCYFIFAIILFIFLIGLICLPNLLNKPVATSSYFLLKLTFWFNKLNIFFKTYVILFNLLGPAYTKYLVFFVGAFLKWSQKKRRNLILIFVALPRIIIILVLFLEIYLQKIHYYFYAMLLLLLLLLFKIFVFMLKDIGPRLLPEFEAFLIKDSPEEVVIEFGRKEKR